MTDNEYLQQQYREAMRSINWISFNDWVAQRNPQPQRTWVGLTPQERDEINKQVYGAVPHHVAFHAAIEAKLKEKNT